MRVLVLLLVLALVASALSAPRKEKNKDKNKDKQKDKNKDKDKNKNKSKNKSGSGSFGSSEEGSWLPSSVEEPSIPGPVIPEFSDEGNSSPEGTNSGEGKYSGESNTSEGNSSSDGNTSPEGNTSSEGNASKEGNTSGEGSVEGDRPSGDVEYTRLHESGMLILGDPAKELVSLGFPESAPANLRQSWSLATYSEDGDTRLKITCSTFNMPQQSNECDHYELFIDDGDERHRFCGEKSDFTYITKTYGAGIALHTGVEGLPVHLKCTAEPVLAK